MKERLPPRYILKTGQERCYHVDGNIIPCSATGQDGEYQVGVEIPCSRFGLEGQVVFDNLTGLTWTRDANINTFPMSWKEGFAFLHELNKDNYGGYSDWRMPNRRELRSLLHMETMNPVLPSGHPFINVFHGWYWTSTTAAINRSYAWYIHLGGARMFYGRKDQECIVWPVRGDSRLIPATGQKSCFDVIGRVIPCAATCQDGEFKTGVAWPEPRFTGKGQVVFDNLTGLAWTRDADLGQGLISWLDAFGIVRNLNTKRLGGLGDWRLPNINELESLVDCQHHSPALPKGHPFVNVQEFYWSSTTSFFEPTWSWALYLQKGAIGVGLKKGRHFHCWAVRSGLGDRIRKR